MSANDVLMFWLMIGGASLFGGLLIFAIRAAHRWLWYALWLSACVGLGLLAVGFAWALGAC